MQNESIELPNNMDDMQLLLLKFREDIITGFKEAETVILCVYV